MTIAAPPYETSGSGTPTTGARPVTIAMLTAKNRKKVTAIPCVNSDEKRSRMVSAVTTQKAMISHRGRALRAMVDRLRQHH